MCDGENGGVQNGMKYDFESALITLINSLLINTPITVTVILISVITILVLDKFNLIKQPRKKERKK